MLYTFPQSVGIAGGRPSSSYYFVGSQTDNLFYLDPHHARPAIPLRPPPLPLSSTTLGAGGGSGSGVSTSASTSRPRASGSSSGYGTEDGGDERENERGIRNTKERVSSKKVNKHQARSSSGGSGGSVGSAGSSSGSHQPGSPSSARTGSSFHVPLAPSPLQQQYSHMQTSPPPSGSSSRNGTYPIVTSSGPGSVSPQPPYSRSSTNSPASASVPSPSSDYMDYSELSGAGREHEHHLTPLEEHYATAYSAAELKTFHCDRVRKMPLSGLDPSMLIGFLCRDEKDWVDFRRRVGQVCGLPSLPFSTE